VESVRIDYEPYSIRLFGKGRKSRIVPMVKEQTEILRQYMAENHLNDSNVYASPLFVNRNKKCSDFGKKNYSGNGNSLCSNFGNNSAVTVVLN
jgi:site-specific recombinase XerD